LQAVQQPADLGNIVVGGSQNLLACGVWSLVRLTLLVCRDSANLSFLTPVLRLRHWLATTIDSKLAVFQSDLDLWATSIKDEVNLIMAQQLANEATQHSRF
jgi:hypothetical protein